MIVSRIYGLNPKTLIQSIRRNSKNGKHSGHNQVLKFYESKTIHQFIKSLLQHDILPIHKIVFDAILHLKHAHDSANKNPTKR